MIYLLDTNLISHIIRDDIPGLRQRLKKTAALHDIAVSAISAGELFYGLARRGHPKVMTQGIEAMLASVSILPWTEDTARQYGQLRATCETSGINLTLSDMMIAAQAVTAKAILVSRDRAFVHLKAHLQVEDWIG
ncbi:type II toxin-antitoxin system VapC family toxin [Asticcacaulis taihuensis]|uniref:type II toxin-antitoxin system VapC family toxin n=1 Tax=Asticcacaulis taihuensis TaxID=260084 RepID=UPI0026ECC4F1|nr:type II toxin-antitoxin system VapC family toxin [Asticcacaulis taihuensis]